MSKLIGVLGGMGPMATIDFMRKLISITPVRTEQDHARMLVFNNPQIPSRIEALSSSGISPLPALIYSALLLEKAGADFLVMPCHSAHYWFEEISHHISIPFYSMIDCTVEEIRMGYNKGSFLLLATNTTLQSNLYQIAFRQIEHAQLILPQQDDQAKIQALIQYIKLHPAFNLPLEAFDELNAILYRYKKNVNYVIGGCTEIPLLKKGIDPDFVFIDPTELLARKALMLAKR